MVEQLKTKRLPVCLRTCPAPFRLSSIQHLVSSQPSTALWAAAPERNKKGSVCWVKAESFALPPPLLEPRVSVGGGDGSLPLTCRPDNYQWWTSACGGPDPPLKRRRSGWSLIRCEIRCQSLHWLEEGVGRRRTTTWAHEFGTKWELINVSCRWHSCPGGRNQTQACVSFSCRVKELLSALRFTEVGCPHRCHWVKAGWRPVQVASSLQVHIETKHLSIQTYGQLIFSSSLLVDCVGKFENLERTCVNMGRTFKLQTERRQARIRPNCWEAAALLPATLSSLLQELVFFFFRLTCTESEVEVSTEEAAPVTA